jgi:release factor glutamine methyltransferase
VTVRGALCRAADELAAQGVPTPEVDAEWLLAHVLGSSRTELRVRAGRELDTEEEAAFAELVSRRARREPLAYVLGEWGFRRLTLEVDGRALVPRPETEIVVERCLALLDGAEAPRVLDVGTGSGAIALAIADEHPGARVTGVDVSADALSLARENADRLGLSVDLRLGGPETAAETWDLVVSNPPYVSPSEYEALATELRDWEPRVALVGEGVHEDLAARVRSGRLVLEVGDGQARAVADALRALGYDEVRITADLAGRERVVEGRRR